METIEKRCAICSNVFSEMSLQCPKCGSGVFESKKKSTALSDQGSEPSDPFGERVSNVSSDRNKKKRSWLQRLFGRSTGADSGSSVVESQKKSAELRDSLDNRKALWIVGKEAITSLDTTLISNDAISVTRRKLQKTHSFTPMAFLMNGYDDDQREVYEIPEIRAWCKKLYREAPSVLCFVDAQTLYWMLLCIGDVEIVNVGTARNFRWRNPEALFLDIYKLAEQTYNTVGATQEEQNSLWSGLRGRANEAFQRYGFK